MPELPRFRSRRLRWAEADRCSPASRRPRKASLHGLRWTTFWTRSWPEWMDPYSHSQFLIWLGAGWSGS